MDAHFPYLFKKILLGFVLLSGIFLYSCGDTIRAYHSSGIYFPLFKQKNQVQADGEIGVYSYQGRAAYSFANHFAVFGDYYYRSPFWRTYETDNFKDWNAGGEYFTQINDKVTFEILGGYGLGSAYLPRIDADYISCTLFEFKFSPIPIYSLSSNYQRVLVQPNIGFHKGKMNYGFGLRFSLLDFNKFNYNETFNEVNPTTSTFVLPYNQICMIEPGAFMSKRFLSINKFSADWYINAGGALPIGPKEPLPFWSVFFRAGIKMKLN